MVLILRSFLVVIHHMIVNTEVLVNHGLLLTSILATCNSGIESSQYLVTITKIVFDCCSAGFIIIHVEHLTKIHRCSEWSSVTT
ncbi:AC5 protein [Velvet bean severe mosaic virus]|uniref:AC5 protein n=1 Tax=Velvet bean severe mosaic virus TaxID=667119 RepID=C9YHE9_9GEMI|nr:AC5 protein [Velvet bean severe mosaic virus]CBA34958.1 AC5 protein [Velvet bean severe mosaic virus]